MVALAITGDSERLQTILRNHPLFSTMSDVAIRAMIAGSGLTEFGTGQILLREGEESDSALLILDGTVEVLVQTTTGTVTVGEQGEGGLLGEIGVFADLPRTATVRARTDGQALWMERQAILRLGHDDPAALRFVVGQLGRRLNTFNQAVATYTNALAALDAVCPDPRILDDLRNPPASLLNFALTFRRLAEQLVEHRDQREEMAGAAAIQRAMLPDPLPTDPRHRVAVHAAIRPAGQVGGDFYDVFFLDADRIAVTIGDASGKGVPASLFVAVCQTVMRLTLRENGDLGRAVTRANAMIDADNRAAMFATFFVGVLHLETGELSYCNAGHVAPTLLHRGVGRERLAHTGAPLAAIGPTVYTTHKARLRPGDMLMLHTDGITEAHDVDDQMFGDARLQEILDHAEQRTAVLPAGDGAIAADVVVSLFKAVDRFTGECTQFDDMTALALSYAGSSA